MEDLWKKFKQETKEDLLKIKEFLNETSLNEKSDQVAKRISRHLVLDEETVLAIKNANERLDETSIKQINEKSQKIPRKKIYGKLKDLVKEIMEKENLSRAQAYRKAKERLINV